MSAWPKLLFVVSIASSGACATTTAEQPRRDLPFHVAVAPVQVQCARFDRASAGEEDAYEVTLNGELATKLLVDELRRRVFVRVSPLPEVPDVDRLSLAERQQRQSDVWMAAARDMDADLLLVPELRYAPEIDVSLDWTATMLNVPVFLFLGPCSYWIADNHYSVDATLNGRLVDLHRTSAAASSIDWATIASVRSRFNGATFNYIARSDRAVEYLWTAICPPTFLKSESASVADALERDVLVTLVRSAADQLASDEHRVLRPDLERSFYIPSGQLTASLHPESVLAIEAPVFLPTSRSDVFIKGYTLYIGDYEYAGFFEDPVQSDSAFEGKHELIAMYRLSTRIDEIEEPVDTFALEVTGGDGAVRTFTGRIKRVATPYSGGAFPATAKRQRVKAIEAKSDV